MHLDLTNWGIPFEVHTWQSGNIGVFFPRIIFARCYKKLVFLPQLSVKDTRQAREHLTTKFKNLATRLK